MRSLPIVVAAVLWVSLVSADTFAMPDTERAAVSAAQNWLRLIDDGNFGSSWNGASTYFRGAISEQNWAASLAGVRKPLGKVISRRIAKTQSSNSLPGAPDGKYVVMSFKTVFEHKKAALETVTFMLDNDNTWKAAGYFIK